MSALMAEVDGVTLRFLQTVPCDLTHRRAVGEVFVTDSAQVDDSRFLAAMQLPRAHALWGDRRTLFHDPLAIVEAGRQVTFLTIHRYLEVPLGLPFILSNVDFEVLDLPALADGQAEPLQAVVRLSMTDRREQEGILTNLGFRGTIYVEESPAMELGGVLQFVSRNDYKMLRAFARRRKKVDGMPMAPRPAPIAAELVGRMDARNVALGEGRVLEGDAWCFPVIVDQTHPSFFDHPQDHVPGPLILEAYRQAAILAACRTGALASPGAVVTRAEMRFTEFGEFEAVNECTAKVRARLADGSVEVEVALRQLDLELASAVYRLTPCPPAASS